MTEVHSYQLSTAEDELGVVLADSEEGMFKFFKMARAGSI